MIGPYRKTPLFLLFLILSIAPSAREVPADTWSLTGSADSMASSFPVDLPQTGQTTCYDASGNVIPCGSTGQDGEIQAGVPWPNPRFTDHGNGTVTDNLTGLMWLKDANCYGLKTWQDALDTVARFNTAPATHNCVGYDESNPPYGDWRLPNINEL